MKARLHPTEFMVELFSITRLLYFLPQNVQDCAKLIQESLTGKAKKSGTRSF